MLQPIMLALLTLTAPQAETPAPPPQPVVLEAPQEKAPVRSVRRLSLAANTGWNSMAGAGLEVGINLTPHLSLDVAGGYSPVTGWRTSIRPRYNLFESRFTPFVGLAANINPQDYVYNMGVLGLSTGHSYSSLFLTPTVGITVQGYGGFFFLAGVGYSMQVAGRRPTTDPDFTHGLFPIMGNSLSADLAIGFAF